MEPLRENTNIAEYHNVIAHSLALINQLLAEKREEQAKKILEYQITYAYTLWKVDEDNTDKTKPETIFTEIKNLKLSAKDVMELVTLMVYFQSKAGIKPVQVFKRNAPTFDKWKTK